MHIDKGKAGDSAGSNNYLSQPKELENGDIKEESRQLYHPQNSHRPMNEKEIDQFNSNVETFDQHSMVMSYNPEANYSDDSLHLLARDVVAKMQEKLPDDNFSYLYAIHRNHDGTNAHIHIHYAFNDENSVEMIQEVSRDRIETLHEIEKNYGISEAEEARQLQRIETMETQLSSTERMDAVILNTRDGEIVNIANAKASVSDPARLESRANSLERNGVIKEDGTFDMNKYHESYPKNYDKVVGNSIESLNQQVNAIEEQINQFAKVELIDFTNAQELYENTLKMSGYSDGQIENSLQEPTSASERVMEISQAEASLVKAHEEGGSFQPDWRGQATTLSKEENGKNVEYYNTSSGENIPKIESDNSINHIHEKMSDYQDKGLVNSNGTNGYSISNIDHFKHHVANDTENATHTASLSEANSIKSAQSILTDQYGMKEDVAKEAIANRSSKEAVTNAKAENSENISKLNEAVATDNEKEMFDRVVSSGKFNQQQAMASVASMESKLHNSGGAEVEIPIKAQNEKLDHYVNNGSVSQLSDTTFQVQDKVTFAADMKSKASNEKTKETVNKSTTEVMQRHMNKASLDNNKTYNKADVNKAVSVAKAEVFGGINKNSFSSPTNLNATDHTATADLKERTEKANEKASRAEKVLDNAHASPYMKEKSRGEIKEAKGELADISKARQIGMIKTLDHSLASGDKINVQALKDYVNSEFKGLKDQSTFQNAKENMNVIEARVKELQEIGAIKKNEDGTFSVKNQEQLRGMINSGSYGVAVSSFHTQVSKSNIDKKADQALNKVSIKEFGRDVREVKDMFTGKDRNFGAMMIGAAIGVAYATTKATVNLTLGGAGKAIQAIKDSKDAVNASKTEKKEAVSRAINETPLNIDVKDIQNGQMVFEKNNDFAKDLQEKYNISDSDMKVVREEISHNRDINYVNEKNETANVSIEANSPEMIQAQMTEDNHFNFSSKVEEAEGARVDKLVESIKQEENTSIHIDVDKVISDNQEIGSEGDMQAKEYIQADEIDVRSDNEKAFDYSINDVNEAIASQAQEIADANGLTSEQDIEKIEGALRENTDVMIHEADGGEISFNLKEFEDGEISFDESFTIKVDGEFDKEETLQVDPEKELEIPEPDIEKDNVEELEPKIEPAEEVIQEESLNEDNSNDVEIKEGESINEPEVDNADSIEEGKTEDEPVIENDDMEIKEDTQEESIDASESDEVEKGDEVVEENDKALEGDSVEQDEDVSINEEESIDEPEIKADEEISNGEGVDQEQKEIQEQDVSDTPVDDGDNESEEKSIQEDKGEVIEEEQSSDVEITEPKTEEEIEQGQEQDSPELNENNDASLEAGNGADILNDNDEEIRADEEISKDGEIKQEQEDTKENGIDASNNDEVVKGDEVVEEESESLKGDSVDQEEVQEENTEIVDDATTRDYGKDLVESAYDDMRASIDQAVQDKVDALTTENDTPEYKERVAEAVKENLTLTFEDSNGNQVSATIKEIEDEGSARDAVNDQIEGIQHSSEEASLEAVRIENEFVGQGEEIKEFEKGQEANVQDIKENAQDMSDKVDQNKAQSQSQQQDLNQNQNQSNSL